MTSRKNSAGTTGADRGTIVGRFRHQADAERAIRDLKGAGWRHVPALHRLIAMI